jgi:hypothetical protein
MAKTAERRAGSGVGDYESIFADRLIIRGVRLPYLKFPRNPER